MSSAQGDSKPWLVGVFDRAAPSYDQIGMAYHEPFGRRLVEAAGIGTGAVVLDVACGRGAVLLPAAERTGTTGSAIGLDISEEMVRLAADRLRNGFPHALVRVMDAENLEFDDRSVDVVLCGFGVFFFPDPLRAIAEFFRVLRPGGVVGLSTWGDEDPRWRWEDELVASMSVARRAITQAFDEPGEVEALLSSAGFEKVRRHVEHLDIHFQDENEWWAWQWSYSIRGMLEQLDDAALERYRTTAFVRMARQRETLGFPRRLTAQLTIAHKQA